MTATDTDKAIFGDFAEEIDKARTSNPTAEELATKAFGLFMNAAADSPAKDLFKRRRWSDLLTVLVPDAHDSYRYDFIEACLRREALDCPEDGTPLFELVDHAMQDDRVNEIAVAIEAGQFEDIVEKACPQTDKPLRDRLARRLRDVYIDPDKIAEEIDHDIAKGKMSVGDAVRSLMWGLFPSPQAFFAAAAADTLTRLLPNAPPDFMEDCKRALRRIIDNDLGNTVIHTVTETKFVPPPPPPDDVLQAKHWATAKERVERIASLAKPLTAAGLDGKTTMEIVWGALSYASDPRYQTGSQTPPTEIAPHFGTTIFGPDDDDY